MKKIFLFICCLVNILLFSYSVHAQTDTTGIKYTVEMQDVRITGYLQPQFRWSSPASVALLNDKQLSLQTPASLVPVMNTVPGIRMEERSPGSYRLSIRGSLVRSPYGVRNVKVYYNGFALTDGGGNTYLNALNVSDLEGVEILKGPDGSLFGANSGGVVLLKSDLEDTDNNKIRLFGGSYGFIGNSALIRKQTGNHTWSARQSFQRADGYRRNTRNKRLFFQIADKWNYSRYNYLELYAYYSDFDYRTPGGLTLEQYEEDPRQSRPATSRLPGSAEQKTGVNSTMYFAGIRNHIHLLPFLEHTISLWGTYSDYTNRAISNYETRDEKNLGLRTFFSFHKSAYFQDNWKPSLQIGFEGQRMTSDIHNYDNLSGDRGDLQVYNDILSHQYFVFLRGDIRFQDKLVFQAAVSRNFSGYHFRDVTNIRNNFKPVWMPHVAVNYMVSKPVSLRLTFSRGYSTPTTAEIRPTDNQIYDNLQAEKGWNTEAGVRLKFLNDRIRLDASGFHYLLTDGIISQINETGDTYFVNSGRIRQLGLEFTGTWVIKPYTTASFFRSVQWNSSYTYSHFKYDRYESNDSDYTGNRVAGIPRHVAVNNVELRFPHGLYLFFQHNFTGKIPLNDANSEFAEEYNLASLRLGFDRTNRLSWPVEIYAAVDNLFNEKYSLGNDINAFGSRYYNPAPALNIQLGLAWKFR